jgi:hypothetical protein
VSRIDALTDHDLEQVRVHLVDAIDQVNIARSVGVPNAPRTRMHLAYAAANVTAALSILEVPSVLEAVSEFERHEQTRVDL